jgi:hypothetical protein
MVRGLLMELDDHNCQPVAEAAGHRGPHRLQHLLALRGLGRAAGSGHRVGVGGQASR